MVEHEPVLVAEVLAGLALTRDGWYVDATYGRGGHSTEILARLGDQGRVLALDKDPLFDASQIRVGVRGRTVRLTGLLPTSAERDAAEWDAWYVFGVDDVINEIETGA